MSYKNLAALLIDLAINIKLQEKMRNMVSDELQSYMNELFPDQPDAVQAFMGAYQVGGPMEKERLRLLIQDGNSLRMIGDSTSSVTQAIGTLSIISEDLYGKFSGPIYLRSTVNGELHTVHMTGATHPVHEPTNLQDTPPEPTDSAKSDTSSAKPKKNR